MIIPQEGHFVHPTVFAKTNADMKLVKEEIFGPVVCAQPFSDESLEKLPKKQIILLSVFCKRLDKGYKYCT